MQEGGFGPRYRVSAPLGEGGMSEVVQAFDRARGEDVAIKILSAASPSVRLGGEFRYIASLHHPGVVSVYDFGLTTDGRPFYTMEMLSDGDLLDVAERCSLSATLRAAREVFRTLDFVHARGIVHADLKPSNILMGRLRGGDHYPKLLDFGVAWTKPEEQTGGTVHYMAPELLVRGERDHRSDLYAMGVVLFELLTGELPFDDPNMMRLAQQHVLNPPPDPRDVAPHVPGELAELTLRLLEKHPKDRFQRGREVVAAIDAFLAKHDAAPSSRREGYIVAEPDVRIAGGSRHVGHDAELELLLDATKDLESNGGAVFVVSGESGAGKTRLLNELQVAAQLRGISSLHVDLQGARDGYAVIDRLAITLAAASDQRVAGASDAARADPIGSDRLILEGERLAQVALELATQRPLVLGIEGLAGLPVDGGKALRAFALRASAGRILTVVTTQGSIDDAPGELLNVDGAQHVLLRRVSRQACAEIVRSLLGEMDGADAIVDHVYHESGGNPGAMERVVHALAATDAIVLRRDTWQVATELGGVLPKLSAESGLRKIAAASIAALSPSERDVARAAAHIGESFDVEVLAALTSGDVQNTLLDLVSAQIVEPEGESASTTWTRFRFAQRALREVLHDETDSNQATAWSQLIVSLLEKRVSSDAQDSETLSRHLLLLGDAAASSEVAATALQARESTTATMVDVLREAVDAPSWRARGFGQRWCELAMLLADIDRRQGHGDRAIESYRRIAERAPAAAHGIRLAAQRELGDLLMGRGDDTGEEVLRNALDESRALGDVSLIGRAAYTLGNRYVLAGRHEEASLHLSEALDVSEQTADRTLRAQALKLRATLEWLRGKLEEAESCARQAVEEYRGLGAPQGIAMSLGALANVLYTRGDVDAAGKAYHQALKYAHEAGWLTGIGKLEASLAAVAYHNDDWAGANEHQDAALTILERVGNRSDQVIQLQGRAFIEVKRGEIDAARRNSQRALALAREAQYRKGEAEVLSNLGEVSLVVGALDEAEQYFEESLEIARAIGATSAIIETERRMLELDLARHVSPLKIAGDAQALYARAEEASIGKEAMHIRRVEGIALARAREPNEAKAALDDAHEGFLKLGSKYEAARTVRIICELMATGLVSGQDMEEELRKACRVFRRLRAQPELDAARRIRDRLGIAPSSISSRGLSSSAYAPSWETPEPPSSDRAPPSWRVAVPREPAPEREVPSHARVTEASVDKTQQKERIAIAATKAVPSLVEISRELSETLELEELLGRIIDAAIGESGAERGFVIACDRSGQPNLRVSRGLGGIDLDDDLELSRSAVGRVIATRQRLEWRRSKHKANTGPLGESVMLLGLQAVVALPLIHRSKLWGVLYVDTRRPDADLTGSRLASLEALAAHAAVAIQNARVFEELGHKNELMAAAINELRHPVDAIARCAERVLDDAKGTPNARVNETIRDHARRLSLMVTRLLELATAEASDVGRSKVSVQVRDLVDAAVLEVRPLDDLDEIAFEVDVPWGLPTVLGHREQLIQVIASMLATASRHAEPGGRVQLRATAVDPPEPENSDPFFEDLDALYADDAVRIEVRYAVGDQDPNPLDVLGLAIAREIITHHGGSWSIDSQSGWRSLVAILPSLIPDSQQDDRISV